LAHCNSFYLEIRRVRMHEMTLFDWLWELYEEGSDFIVENEGIDSILIDIIKSSTKYQVVDVSPFFLVYKKGGSVPTRADFMKYIPNDLYKYDDEYFPDDRKVIKFLNKGAKLVRVYKIDENE
jgi:hypothetical protein